MERKSRGLAGFFLDKRRESNFRACLVPMGRGRAHLYRAIVNGHAGEDARAPMLYRVALWIFPRIQRSLRPSWRPTGSHTSAAFGRSGVCASV